MSHNNYNYIICQCADGFDFISAGFGPQAAEDQEGSYCIIDKKDLTTAASVGYTPGSPYPSWITDICPNAPDATHSQAFALVNTVGPAGSAWRSE